MSYYYGRSSFGSAGGAVRQGKTGKMAHPYSMNQIGKLGRSPMDFLMGKSLNENGEVANRFADSSYRVRKQPMTVGYFDNGADVYKQKLAHGYRAIAENN